MHTTVRVEVTESEDGFELYIPVIGKTVRGATKSEVKHDAYTVYERETGDTDIYLWEV